MKLAADFQGRQRPFWLLDWLSRPNYFMANLVGRGQVINPLAPTDEERIGFGDVLKEQGYLEDRPWLRGAAGLGLDIATDPTTYIPAAWIGKAAKAIPGVERGLSFAKSAALDPAKAWLYRAGARVHTADPLLNEAIDTGYRQGVLRPGAEAHDVITGLEKTHGFTEADYPEIDKILADVTRVPSPSTRIGAIYDKLREEGDKLFVVEKGVKGLSPLSQNQVSDILNTARRAGIRDKQRILEMAADAPEEVKTALQDYRPDWQAGSLSPVGRDIVQRSYGGLKQPVSTGRGAYEYSTSMGTLEKHMGRFKPGESIPEFNKGKVGQEMIQAYGPKPKEAFWQVGRPTAENISILEPNTKRRFASAYMKAYKAKADKDMFDSIVQTFGKGEVNLADPTWRGQLRQAAISSGDRNLKVFVPSHQIQVAPPDALKMKKAGLLDETGNWIGSPDDLEEFVKNAPSAVKGTILPREAADVVNRIRMAQVDPDSMFGVIGKGLRGFQNYWKPWVLATPGYTVRNALTNAWKMWMGDGIPVRNPAEWRMGMKAKRNIADFTVQTPKGVLKGEDVLRTGRALGVPGGHTASAMGEKAYQVTKFKEAPLRKTAEVIRKGNEFVEDSFRWTMYINRLSKGDTAEQAAEKVNKYLFDYRRVSPVGAALYAHVMPFGRWIARNVPNELENLMRHPGRYANFAKVVRDVSQTLVPEPPSDEFLAEYMKDEMGIPWHKNADGTYMYALGGRWHPIGDIVRLIPWENPSAWGMLDKLLGTAVEQFGGPPKAIIEGITNKSSFFGDIERYPGQPGYVAGVRRLGIPGTSVGFNIPRRAAHVIEGAFLPMGRPLSALSRTLNEGGSLPEAVGRAAFGIKGIKYDVEKGKKWTLAALSAKLGQAKGDLTRAKAQGDLRGIELAEKNIAFLEAQKARVAGS